MEIKLFKLKTCISPEWGATYDRKTYYYISNDVEKVLKKVYNDHGYRLSGSDGKWSYDHYYSMDREELNVFLEEVKKCSIVI